MTYSIRRLNPATDATLFRQAHGWLVSAPRWQRDAFTVFNSLELDDYLLATYSPNRIDIGVFDGGLTAIITLTLVGPGIYEAHLEARRGTSTEVLTDAIAQVREQMFGRYNARQVFTWQPTANCAVRTIEKAVGFRSSGVSMFRGVSHNRPIEWEMLSLERRMNGRQ